MAKIKLSEVRLVHDTLRRQGWPMRNGEYIAIEEMTQEDAIRARDGASFHQLAYGSHAIVRRVKDDSPLTATPRAGTDGQHQRPTRKSPMTLLADVVAPPEHNLYADIGTRVHKAIEEHPQVSLYDLLDAYADVIKRKVGKHPALAALYGKRKKIARITRRAHG